MTILNEITSEVRRRKTFAIISHPDAGKTTLTEKLLLYGGAIRLAGSVKSRKAQKYAVSDWMEIEKQRGISVTSSVMQFDYYGFRVNILDTPGHQDFSEDTYRTLVAADSAVMLIDGAKGVEEQTKKLFHVCRVRGIPIFTFVNKLDRYCKSPFELMEELEAVLGIRSYPMNWPIRVDGNFKGVYNRKLSQIELFETGDHGANIVESTSGSVEDPRFVELLGKETYEQLVNDIALLDIAGDAFDLEKVKNGELTPMFFGSAMSNFGVQPFLEEFLQLAPAPVGRVSTDGPIDPENDFFSGFVFKIQANMNPTHRDRIAFIRICSGKFSKGMEVNHTRVNKPLRLAQPQQFLAQDRTIVEEAYAGDIIGVFDPGIFNLGDTLVEGKKGLKFEGIPLFPAEHFAAVSIKDAMKRKQFVKGLYQIAEEGAIQIFRQPSRGSESYVVGVVGALQFEVLEYRLQNEYGVTLMLQQLPYTLARWVSPYQPGDKVVGMTDSVAVVEDEYGRPVFLFQQEWSFKYIADKNKDLMFVDIPPSYEK